jgi:hypothetical protein
VTSTAKSLLADDRPLTLKEAAERFGFTVSTLRAEAGRGRLCVFRIGKRDYTLAADVQEMIRRCRAEDSRRASILTPADVNGLSATEQASYAQAALRQSMKALRSDSQRISARSTPRDEPPRH